MPLRRGLRSQVGGLRCARRACCAWTVRAGAHPRAAAGEWAPVCAAGRDTTWGSGQCAPGVILALLLRSGCVICAGLRRAIALAATCCVVC
eukprot:4120585-Prymnesium_polylepis.1